jgi:hypothetical protein
MLEELKNYENLGSPQYFWELFNILKKDDIWTEKNISSYFLNKIINERSIFDGCLPLLKLSKIIYLDKKTNEVKIDFRFKYILYTKERCKQKLLEGFLNAFYKDENFYKIFSSNNISYDVVYKAIQINYSAFGLKYSNIRKLLIDFNFLKAHPNFPQKKLIVNYKWKQFFDKNFIPKIGKKKIDIEELRKNLEQQQINGEEAEKFVLNFEKNRLKNKKGIEWIAPYDASAGYDILSFKNINSKENNKFIEVKSYAGDSPYFYWSKNEISIARKKEKNYCLYLVNREDINSDSYKPLIVSDPIKNILSNNNWKKEINTYYIINNKLNR